MSEIPREAIEAAAKAIHATALEDRSNVVPELGPDKTREDYAIAALEAALPHLPGLHLTTEEIEALLTGGAKTSARAKLRVELERRNEEDV